MNPEQEVGKPKSSLAGDIDGNRKSSCQHWKKEQENVGPPLNEVIGPHGKGQGINQGTPWLHHDFINKTSLPHFHCTWPHLYNTQYIYCMHMATEGINPCVSLISVNLLLIIFERFWLWGGGSRELRGKKKEVLSSRRRKLQTGQPNINSRECDRKDQPGSYFQT